MRPAFIIPVLITALLGLSVIVKCDEIPEIACTFEIAEAESVCYYQGLNLDQSNYRFQPVAEAPKNITILIVTNSTLAGFSREFCDTFPNLRQISTIGVGLEILDADALESCNDLRYLQAFDNHITDLPEQFFRYNRVIQEIDFHDNKIKHIHPTQFRGLKRLNALTLSSNEIEEFPVDSITDTSLLTLELQTNDITYLDVESIVDKLPNLQVIGYQNNELACVRVVEFNKMTEERNIHIIRRAEERIRYHDTLVVDGITCLPDVSWAAVEYRRLKEQDHSQLEALKEELMNEIRELMSLKNKF